MPKLLVWTVRFALLLLTPVFLFCAGVTRSMMWLDSWAAEQLHVDPVVTTTGPGAHHQMR
jgi:hypothetical protein